MRPFVRAVALATCLLLFLVPVAAAQEGDDLQVPWFDEENQEFAVDGKLDERMWQEAAHRQVTLDDEDGGERFAHLYLAHNGTSLHVAVVADGATEATLQFSAASGRGSGAGLDAMRVDTEGNVEDLHWTSDDGAWVADASSEGCAGNGTATASSAEDTLTLEIEKPLQGDACDAYLLQDSRAGLRLVLAIDGGTYRWPAGTVDEDGAGERGPNDDLNDESAGWGGFVLASQFGDDTDQDVGDAGDDGRPARGRETAEEEGLATDRPIGARPDDPGGAYEPGETPGPAFALLLVTILAGFVLVVKLRPR